VDGTPVSEVTQPPYSVSLDTRGLGAGAHTITAVARDLSNNTGTSPPASFTINNTNRPNVLFILTDDQRFDTMQYMPLTSNALASETVIFDNAVVTTPDCCPSRASILTGLYSHNTGVLQDYPPSGGATVFNATSTIATWLQDTGYRTGLFGKYLNHYYAVAPLLPPGWSDFQGFVKNAITNSDSDFFYNYVLNDNGTLVTFGGAPQDYSTNVLADKVAQFITATPGGQPFFAYYSPYAPHDPFIPDPADVGSFAGIAPWRPPSFNEGDVSDKPAWVRNLPLLTAADISDGDLRRQRQIESLQGVDRQVARLINLLKQSGRWNNTLVIFMSDNGYMWGEHRIPLDKFVAYDESVRVPMWVRAPGLTSRRDPSLVAGIDIAPSVADWAGVIPNAPKVNGQSFITLLSNQNAPWRSGILLEYLGPTINTPKRFQAVRTSQYLYSELPTGERELYDLTADPYQLVNEYSNPAYATVIPGLQTLLNGLKSQ
jgi:arylsulfatase A-like enzyme